MKPACRFFLPMLWVLFFPGCREETAPMLREVEGIVETAPDSALAALERILPENLHGKRLRAQYTLLHAMALDGTFGPVDVADEAALARAADWFARKGSPQECMKAWFYLGRTQYLAGHYNSAIVSYSRAEEAARKAGATAFCGQVYREMAHTCNASFNHTEEAAYLEKAVQAYGQSDMPAERDKALLEAGLAFYNAEAYSEAEKIYKSVLYTAHEAADTLLEARCLTAYAALCLTRNEQDPALAIDLLSRSADALRYPLSPEDKGLLAYAYALTDDLPEAGKWLREARRDAETPDEWAKVHFREYQIYTRSGETEKALEALEKVTEHDNAVQAAALRNSALSSQKEYFEQQGRAAHERLRLAHWILWLLGGILVLGGVAGWLLLRTRRLRAEMDIAEEKAENERLMALAEELQTKLSAAARRLPSEKHFAIAKMDILERLCEQYYIYEGTDNLQPKVLKEVRSVITQLRQDPQGLETLLNRQSDGLMQAVRAAFPKWKEEDFRLYAFLAAGFSATAVSTLLEKDKTVVYNRISRLKKRIEATDIPSRDRFLDAIS